MHCSQNCLLLELWCPATLVIGVQCSITSPELLAYGSSCAVLCFAEFVDGCGIADGKSGPAVLAACAATRWLARNAPCIKLIRCSRSDAAALACTSLVSCLPALEHVDLCFSDSLLLKIWGCLLEALAWCPRLRVLDLCAIDGKEGHPPQLFPASGSRPPLRSCTA